MVVPQQFNLRSIDHFWTTIACNGSVSWYIRYYPNQLGGPTKTTRLSKNVASMLVAANVPMSERRSTTRCRVKTTKTAKARSGQLPKQLSKNNSLDIHRDSGIGTCSNRTVQQCKESCYLVSVLLLISKLSVIDELNDVTQAYVNQVHTCPRKKINETVCELIPAPIRALYRTVYGFYNKDTLLKGGSAELLMACILKANGVPFVFVGEPTEETEKLKSVGVETLESEDLGLKCFANENDTQSEILSNCVMNHIKGIPSLVAHIESYMVLSVDLRDAEGELVVPIKQTMQLMKLLAHSITRMRGGVITVEKKSKKAHGVHEVSFTICRKNNEIEIKMCNMWGHTKTCQDDIFHKGLDLRSYKFCNNVCCFIDKV